MAKFSFLKLWFLFSLVFNILAVIGLVFITKFSFNASTLDLESWQKGFARFTIVLLWISLISAAVIILGLLFMSKFNPFLHLVVIALLVIEIMGLVYINQFFYKDSGLTLETWQYNFTKVTVIITWIIYSIAIISDITLLSSSKAFNLYWGEISKLKM